MKPLQLQDTYRLAIVMSQGGLNIDFFTRDEAVAQLKIAKVALACGENAVFLEDREGLPLVISCDKIQAILIQHIAAPKAGEENAGA